ncbi:hypothetical protein B0H11DRAFT_2118403 [Mycena galericulata]|nr:hypothetical protein B0H11DRAFT_2118403 [Mycena galericulata]
MSLTESPLDILLEIISHLDLQDSLRLVATCTTCKSLALSPSFWIMALNRMEQVYRRPLPCSPGTDIASLPLAKLEKLAIHAYKLRKNWTSQAPRPISVRTMTIDDHVHEFLPIQGSRLCLTVSTHRLACWDTTSGEFLGAFDKPGGYSQRPRTSTYLGRGICTLGIGYLAHRSSDVILELGVFRIDHQDPSSVAFSKVVSKNWVIPQTPFSLWDVNVNEEMIAAMLTVNAEDIMLLSTLDSPEDGIRRVSIGPNNLRKLIPQAIVIHGDDIYATRQSIFDDFVEILRIRSPLTASSSTEVHIGIEKRTTPHSVEEIEEIDTPHNVGCLPMRPTSPYGIIHVTPRWGTHLHFWPAEDVGSRLEIGALRFYEHSEDIADLAVGSSRTLALIMDREKTFGIVQYSSHPPTVTFRPLQIPEFEDLDGYKLSLALDDRLGVVYVGNWSPSRSVYTIVSYA